MVRGIPMGQCRGWVKWRLWIAQHGASAWWGCAVDPALAAGLLLAFF